MRVRIELRPDYGTKRWIEKTARLNHWRVASFHDLDDLIQEGYWIYFKLLRMYPEARTRRHIMGLFTRAYTNHMTFLAKLRTRLPEYPIDVSPDRDPQAVLEALALVGQPDGIERPLEAVLQDAPAQARMVLELLISHPEVLSRPYRRRHGTRETMNHRVCRALNLPTNIDLITPTRDYLRGMPTVEQLADHAYRLVMLELQSAVGRGWYVIRSGAQVQT